MSALSERREYKRFGIPCRLRIGLPAGGDLRTRSRNISDGGAYFVTEVPLAVGHRLDLRLAVPRDTANTFFLEQFTTRAEVVRTVPPDNSAARAGVAVRFEDPLSLDLP